MSLVRFALRNPYLILVSVVAVVTVGVIAYFRIPKDLLPLFKTPAVQILTLYPGMPAEVVEKDITSRLERWTGQSNGMARQESRSMIGVSIVRDYFRPDIDPNTAMSQVTSLAISDLYYLPPGTIPPMVMPFDPTATVPLVLLSVSGKDYNEKELYDIAYFDLRNRLQGINGVIAPAVYGGKLRRIYSYVDPEKLHAYNLSPMDVANTLRNFNTLIPTGNMKIGDTDFQVVSNGVVEKVEEMDDFPIRSAFEGSEVLLRDVAKTEDTAQIQNNIVRVNGKRQVYLPAYRQPGANTIEVVDSIRNSIRGILERLPKGISIDLVADQSEYIRQALRNLSVEAVIGGLLAVLMIWLFLGSLKTAMTAAIAIPLSLLATFIGFLFTRDSLNAMTLGGLALAIGRLVDDSIVVTENTVRHRIEGVDPEEASLRGAGEVTLPVLAATLTTVIVFVPVFFLKGISEFLFAPLARSVAFSIGASFVVAMLVIPLLMRWIRFQAQEKATWFQTRFEKARRAYENLLPKVLHRRTAVYAVAVTLFAISLVSAPLVGRELFPSQDVGHLSLKLRLPSGTRIEKTEEKITEVEKALTQVIPEGEIRTVISNIGVLYDWPAAYTPNAGPSDSFMEVQLARHRTRSSQEYVDLLRTFLKERFPDFEAVVDTGSILTAALTFGLPAPIDIQINGNKLDVSHGIAQEILGKIRGGNGIGGIAGLVDVRIQQRLDYPQLTVEVDRRKAAAMGLTAVDVIKNIVTATNSSVSFDPAFWIDPKNGNHYFAGAQYREKDLVDEETLKNIPITSKRQDRVVPLKELAAFGRATAPAEINHVNISRVLDIFANVANVSGRDLGSVSADIERQLATVKLPEGYRVSLKGEWSGFKESFENLSYGFLLAVFLVYLVLVAQFRSLKDPLIILVAVPLGLIGVVAALGLTGSTFNIQSFLGTIFMVGIVVSNSILIVEFANRERETGKKIIDAVIGGASVRLRPILMTSFAAILGLLPMAIGFGHGSEANVPLARAVIGGLLVSTFLSLIVVPCLYFTFHNRGKGGVSKVLTIFLLGSALLFSATVQAQSGEPISFQEAMSYAKEHHPLVQAGGDQVSIGEQGVRAARSGYFPRLQGGIVESTGMNGSYGGLGFRGINNSAFKSGYGVDVELEQTIYDFGRTGNRVKAEKARVEEYRHSQDLTAETVLMEAGGSYFHCQEMGRLKVSFGEALRNLERLAAEVDAFAKTGQRSPVDLHLIRAKLEEMRGNRIAAEQEEEMAIDELNFRLGTPPTIRFRCDPKDPGPEVPRFSSLDRLIEAALDRRPESKRIAFSRERALHEKKAAASEFLPQVTGVASAGDLQGTTLIGEKHYAVGVGLKIPIFDGFKTPAEYRKSKLELSRLDHEVDQIRNRIVSEVRQAYRNYQKTRSLLSVAGRRRLEAREAIRLARERYLAKTGILADWDHAYRAWVESEVHYWKTHSDYRLAKAQLNLAVGDPRFATSHLP